jgi:hypothetical protein
LRAPVNPPMGWDDWRVQEPSQEEDDGSRCSLECLPRGGKTKKKVEVSNFGDVEIATYDHECVGCAETWVFQGMDRGHC